MPATTQLPLIRKSYDHHEIEFLSNEIPPRLACTLFASAETTVIIDIKINEFVPKNLFSYLTVHLSKFFRPKDADRLGESVIPAQTDPLGAVLQSTLFAKTCLSAFMIITAVFFNPFAAN